MFFNGSSSSQTLRGFSPRARRATITGSSLVANQNTIATTARPMAHTCATACQP
jgi:hypothetical protein